MFQDSAGTTPVTANNDPVGRINDKSGNGNHLVQATAGFRPLYKTSGGLRWLEFDGTDDTLALDFADVVQPFDRVSAHRYLTSEDPIRFIGSDGNGHGQLYLTSGEIRIYAGLELTGLAAPALNADFVATERYNGASSRLAVDNGSYQTGDAGASDIGGTALAANPSNSEFANMRFYGLAQFNRLLTDAEIAQLRTYFVAKQGRVL